MAHPATEKRIQKQDELKRAINELGAFIPSKYMGSDGLIRQLGIINQKIQFLVEAAIDEGMDAIEQAFQEKVKHVPYTEQKKQRGE